MPVGARGRQALSKSTTLSTILNTIPDGNTVTISTPGGDNFYTTYAPIYTPLLVGPGATWTGTIETGFNGSLPTVPARTTARPAARLAQPNRQAFDEDFTVSIVGRSANGDISYVECYGDNDVPVTQSTRSIYYYTDDMGVRQALDGFHFTFDISAYLDKVAAGGQINVYFKVYPTDGTMQPQLLGAPTSTPNSSRYATVLNFYPRPVKNTWIKTVASSGTGQSGAIFNGVDYSGVASDYTTVEAALAARATAAATVKGGLIIFTQSGLYTPVNALNAAVYNALDGYMEITQASGVSASIGRSSYSTSTNADGIYNYVWRPAVNGLMVRGGVTIDYAYMSAISMSGSGPNPALPCAANGAVVTASSRDLSSLLWWDKNVLQTGNGFSYFNDCSLSYVGATFRTTVVNNMITDVFADLFSVTDVVVGNIIDGYDPGLFRTHYNGWNVTYTGVAATATVDVSGGSFGVSAPTVTLTDSNNAPFTFVANTGNMADIVNWVNTTVAGTSSGWSATMLATPDDGVTDRNPVNLVRATTQTCKNVTRTFETWIDLHQDFWSMSSTSQNNKVIENNIGINVAYVQEPFFDGTATDIVKVNNAFSAQATNPQLPAETVLGQWAGSPKSHLYNAHNANAGMSLRLRNDGTWSADSYTQLQADVTGYVDWVGTPTTNPVLTNCHSISGVQSGTSQAGNSSTGSSLALMYPARLSMDFTPGSGTPLTTNLVAPVIAYDVIGNTRQATDAKGPWAQPKTSWSLTKAQFLGMAVRTYGASGSLGAITATYYSGASNTGTLRTLVVNVSA